MKKYFLALVLLIGLFFPPPSFSRVKDIRFIDGSNNNKKNPSFGIADQELLRISAPAYEDGISSLARSNSPSPREISNVLVSQNESILNDRNLTDFIWVWGQFLDHDIDLTEGANPAEPAPISVPNGDTSFDPLASGTQTLSFNRSAHNQEDGENLDSPRQQINQITSYIDASNVYGSDNQRAAALRTFSDGLLKTSAGNLLPFNLEGLANQGGTGSNLFLAGDIRANEQIVLTAMHTLFVREHNRIATLIKEKNPGKSDEDIYQEARKQVIGIIQSITYNEFLPALLGKNPLGKYKGYKKKVNPGISNEFSTAAYRFGHSTVSPQILRLDNDGNPVSSGSLSLRDAFFNPSILGDSTDLDEILKGIASQVSQEIDSKIIDDLRNFLFGAPGSGGMDLASLNIQRGRDHGLASYNQMRRDLNLVPRQILGEITTDDNIIIALQTVYDNDLEAIDPWIALLAEDHVNGTSTGETMRAILIDQFKRLRDGDRFFYRRVFGKKKRKEISKTKLSDVIKRNTSITNLQDNVFFL